jgi:hypothetical protein
MRMPGRAGRGTVPGGAPSARAVASAGLVAGVEGEQVASGAAAR